MNAIRKCLLQTLALAALLALVAAPQARADNDQTVVLGAGIGIHEYSKVDAAREGDSSVGIDDVTHAGMSQLYLEWYALGNVGFGIRTIGLGATRTTTILGVEIEEKYETSIPLITIQWVPIGATSYTRFGLIAGAGSADHSYTVTVGGSPSEVTASGSATLAGAFLDWGGEDFGARFGVHSIDTDLGNYKDTTEPAEASGVAWYFDIRWAWK